MVRPCCHCQSWCCLRRCCYRYMFEGDQLTMLKQTQGAVKVEQTASRFLW